MKDNYDSNSVDIIAFTHNNIIIIKYVNQKTVNQENSFNVIKANFVKLIIML